MDFKNFYDNNKFIYFSFDLKYDKEEQKKKYNPPLEWQKKIKSSYNNNNNGLAIITGKTSNIFVLDYDFKDYFKQDILNYPELKNYYVKTKNGYHSYFKYEEKLQENLKSCNLKVNNKKIIDFQGNNKHIISYPTKYNNNKYEYKIKANNELKYMSKELYNFILDKYINIKKEEVKEDKIKKFKEDKILNNNNKEIIELINIIKMDYIDCYDDWTKLIWSLKTNDLYEEAKILSQKSKYWNEEEFNKVYEDFKKSRNNFSLNTFYYYAKLSNEKEFYNIKSKYHNFENIELLTDDDLSKVFIKLYGENYIYYDNKVYYFNGLNWQIEGEHKLKIELSEKLKMFYLNEYSRRIKQNDKGDNKILKLLQRIGNYKTQDYIYKSILKYIHKINVDFEQNKYLIVFKNTIYDIKNNKFLKRGNPEDYMLFNTKINYIQPTEKEIKELDDIINTIFINKEDKKFYLQILYSGLLSQNVENLFIANGSGRNGKGLLNELYGFLLGEYFYNAPNSILMEQIKGGNNQSISNMNYKRVCIYREPDTKGYNKLNISSIKELTGGDKINACGKYSTKDEVNLRATHICECNDKPNISGNSLDTACIERICDIPFNSYFTNNKDEINNINIFECNPFYKTIDFKKKYACALLHIIMKYKYEDKLIIPDHLKERSLNYLMECDDILNYFFDDYIKTEDKKDFIKINDLFLSYKQSDKYINLSKIEKQKISKNSFAKQIKEHKYFKKYYKTRYMNFREIIIYHKIIDIEEDDNNDDINL